MLTKHVRDRATPHLMPQVRKGSLDPRVPPKSVVHRHANHELDDHIVRPRTPWAGAVGIRPFLCDNVRYRRMRALPIIGCALEPGTATQVPT